MPMGPEGFTSALDAIEGFLLAYRCTVGDLIDLANRLSPEELPEVAETLTACITEKHVDRRCRREMVLLGAVMHRLIFSVHRIPKSRDAEL